MGKFSGVLIVSDIDGTLYNTAGQVSRENREALEYFKREGGLFTMASGRTFPDVVKINAKLQLANTSLIGSNGAVVGEGDTVLWQCRFDERLPETVQLLLDHADYCDAEFVTPQYIAYYRPNELTMIHSQYVSDRFEEIHSLSDIPENTAMAAFWMAKERIPEFKALFSKLEIDKRYSAFQGFTYAYEMVPLGYGKGEAALKLKEMTKCHTLVCAGDSGNDVSMLQAADRSFAPRGAMEEAREAAKVTLKSSCDESIYPEIVKILAETL